MGYTLFPPVQYSGPKSAGSVGHTLSPLYIYRGIVGYTVTGKHNTIKSVRHDNEEEDREGEQYWVKSLGLWKHDEGIPYCSQ